jgi:hypothetical protein
MSRDYEEIERMAKDYRISSAERAVILEALRSLEKSYRNIARKDREDAPRLHSLADKTRTLVARFEGTMIGGGYAFTEI